ncbi:hypothetical protein CaCOL14_005462 [Colletotrichum acutatum]
MMSCCVVANEALQDKRGTEFGTHRAGNVANLVEGCVLMKEQPSTRVSRHGARHCSLG